MKLLCHRGIWFTPEEKNTERALGLAFAQGLGIETDVRDCDGQLVVSHDAPLQASAMSLDTLLASYHRSGRQGRWAAPALAGQTPAMGGDELLCV
jgi:glycerophosphoryl diester phosphodiesterase